MDVEDLPPLRRGGQVDEEDLVEAALAEQLGRELLDPVRGGDHEHRRGLLLQPGEERAEHAGGHAAVGHPGGLRSREPLLDLVHPEHHRGDALRHPDRLAEVLLRGADEPAEDPAHVEPQERQAPLRRDRLGGEALPAALHAEEEEPLRLRQAEAARRVGEGGAAPVEPGLEGGEPADVAEPRVGREVLEEPALADHLPLLLEDERHVGPREPAVGGDRLREGALGLGEGEPERGLDELIGVAVGELHLRAVAPAHHADDLLQELEEVAVGRERHVEDRDLLLDLRRDHERRREQDDRRVGGLEGVGEIPERPDHLRILQVRMEVPQDHERRLGELLHGGEGVERALGLRRRPLGAAHAAEPLRRRPAEERLPVALRELGQDRLDPQLLRGDEVDERVAGPHQRVELLDEARRRRAGGLGGRRVAGRGHARESTAGRDRGRATAASRTATFRAFFAVGGSGRYVGES